MNACCHDAWTMNDGCETTMLSNTSSSMVTVITATGTPPPRRRSNDDYCRLRRAAGSQSLSKLIEIITNEKWTAEEIDDNGDDGNDNDIGGNSSNGNSNGKSALHMAAWKGCIENVQYLIENVGCDINSYSKQKFSYGKTAIFFSITQSRIDITDYLLNCQDNSNTIIVTIINNKGQSVLSIAASHFNAGSDVLEKIIELDSIQGQNSNIDDDNNDSWWNFRDSHSDNFEYGDLDPRFIDRPLRETDVVTSLVINPTTKQTRKGGFSRRNPNTDTVNTAVAVGTAPKNSKTDKKKSKRRMHSIKRKKDASLLSALSSHEQYELEEAWENIVSTTPSTTEQSSSLLLLRIVHLSDKQNFAWIPEMTIKLINHFGGGSKDKTIQLIESAIVQNNLCQRQRQKELLQKILHRLQGVQKQQQQQQQQFISSGTMITKTPNVLSSSSFEPYWKIICHEVRHLDMSYLEKKKKTTNFPTILCLPNPPIFVDTVEQLTILQKCTMDRRLIAIDTEWYNTIHEEVEDDDNNNNNNNDSNNHNRQKTTTTTTTTTTITLSTLQISYLESESSNDIVSYVVDLKKGAVLATPAIANYNGNINGDGDGDGDSDSDNTTNPDDDDYHRLVQALVRWLLHRSGSSLVETDHGENNNPFYVLGFSIGHDIPLLEAFLLRGNNNNKNDNDNNSKDCTLSSSSSSHQQQDYHHILDLQKLILAQQQQEPSSSSSSSSTTTTTNNNPPGLKKCVEQYSSSSTTKMAMIFSKEQQCSNWELRPLSVKQLNYAGLDAAILLILLAEHSRRFIDLCN